MEAAMDAMGLVGDLEQMSRDRHRVSQAVGNIVDTLTQTETVSRETSGQLGLAPQIQQVRTVKESLSQGTFRLLVLGDMKRGKSTFLNALLGERLLPSDVNPCTAVLTLIKYGAEKQVTIYVLQESAHFGFVHGQLLGLVQSPGAKERGAALAQPRRVAM
ncbi:MAG: dynamin family protein, partial [Cyanobacteria bacterium P01_F01_bin.86]